MKLRAISYSLLDSSTAFTATITISNEPSTAGVGPIYVGETHADIIARMTDPAGGDTADAAEASTDGVGDVSREVVITGASDPVQISETAVIRVTYSATDASNVVRTLSIGTVIYSPGTFGALATQTFTENTGDQTYVFPAAAGTGLTWTYSLASPVTGVSIDSASRTITFDTEIISVGSSSVSIEATDQYARTASGSPQSFTLEIEHTIPTVSVPSLQVDEGEVQGTLIGVLVINDATNVTGQTLSSITPSGAIQLNADGITIEAGAVPVDFEVHREITATFTFSSDEGGPYNQPITIIVENVNEAPTAINVTLDFDVEANSVAAPDAFDTGDWSVADEMSGGTVTITVSTLPSDNGDSITALQYSVDDGAWSALGGTGTGDYDISSLTNGTAYGFEIRAINSTGNGADGVSKTATPTAVPSAFIVGQWSIADATTGGQLDVTISTLPSANGTAITDLEYKVDAGSWTSFGETTTGTYPITGLTDDVEVDILIRAVNATGNGGDSDLKAETPTTAAGVTQPDVVAFTPSVYFNGIGPTSTGAGHFWAYKIRQATAQSGEQFRPLFGDNAAAYSGPNGSRRMRNYQKDASNNTLSTDTAGASEALTLDQFSCIVGYAYAYSGTWYIGQWTDGVLDSSTTAVVGAETDVYQFRRINNTSSGGGAGALTFDIQGLWLSTASAHTSATPPIDYTDFFDGSGNWLVNTDATVGGKTSDLGLLHDAADWNALPGKTGTVT